VKWLWLFTSFHGHINRTQFWCGLLALLILSVLVRVVVGVILSIPLLGTEGVEGLAWLPVLMVSAATIYSSSAIFAKRFHDRGKSGWWTLMANVLPYSTLFVGENTPCSHVIFMLLLPIWIWTVVQCGCLPSDDASNLYRRKALSA
jgi:uncharacterized membrane protein YhaH (DUF805 family)